MTTGTTPRMILVPLSGVAEDITALRCAAKVAQHFKAHIEAMFVTPDPKDSVVVLGDGLSTLMVDEIVSASQTMWRRRGEAARRAFDTVVAEIGLVPVVLPEISGRATIRWREDEGMLEGQVITEGRLSDLIVFDYRCVSHSDAMTRQGVEAALLFTGRPVLLVPDESAPMPGRVVAIAWDGKLEAARAVAGALPFLERAERLVLLTAGTGRTGAIEGARLAESLAWRGLNTEVMTIEPGGEAVGAAVLRAVHAIGADLLVMGAYGHSRVREMILGGVTRHVIAHAPLHVLMCH